jgi:hypothetical protein
VITPRQLDQRFACFRLHVRRIDDRQLARGESLRGDKVQYFESVLCRGLIVLVVRNKPAAKVR